jgi:hypothetical protein
LLRGCGAFLNIQRRDSLLNPLRSAEAGMSEQSLELENFADKVGQVFTINFADAPSMELKLVEAEALVVARQRAGSRQPFSLVFTGETERLLPQKTYWLEHDGMGTIQIFLVPVGKKPEGYEYQAVFS